MRTSLSKNNRTLVAIFLIAAIFALTAACGGSSEANVPVASGATPTAAPVVEDPTAEPTEPPLVNTPGPVSNIAPDFTLPSIQGSEYTLSQFRGEKPVVVVFYRAYW